jgi:hypothetical protein
LRDVVHKRLVVTVGTPYHAVSAQGKAGTIARFSSPQPRDHQALSSLAPLAVEPHFQSVQLLEEGLHFGFIPPVK